MPVGSRLAAVLLLLVLAGCSDKGDGATDPDAEPTPDPEDDNGVFQVNFTASGLATLEVPLPHLDSCQPPDSWLEGTLTGNAQVELRNASDGRTGQVLAVSGENDVEWSSQIPLAPECQTLVYDPWSIHPDALDGSVEVRLTDGTVSHAVVLVRHVRATCADATLYVGVPGDGWTALEGHTIPTSCG